MAPIVPVGSAGVGVRGWGGDEEWRGEHEGKQDEEREGAGWRGGGGKERGRKEFNTQYIHKTAPLVSKAEMQK